MVTETVQRASGSTRQTYERQALHLSRERCSLAEPSRLQAAQVVGSVCVST